MKIVFHFLFFLFVTTSAAPPIPPVAKNVSHLEQFVANFSSLVRLAGGISLQSTLSDDSFSEVTSKILNHNESFVKSTLRMRPEKISEEVQKIFEKSSNVKLGAGFDLLEYGMTHFQPLFKYADLIANPDTFIQNVDDFVKSLTQFSYSKLFDTLIDMRLPLYIMRCLSEDIKPQHLSNCFYLFEKNMDTLQNYATPASFFTDRTMVGDTFKEFKEVYEKGVVVKALTATVKALGMMTNGMNSVLNVQALFENLRTEFQSQFNELLKSLEGKNAVKQLEKFYVSLTVNNSLAGELSSWEKALSAGTLSLKRMFANLEGEWMKKVVAIGNSTERLMTALGPLKQYTEDMETIENITNKWRAVSDSAIRDRVINSLATIEKWMRVGKFDGHYDVPYDLISPFKQCLDVNFPTFPNDTVKLEDFDKVTSNVIELINLIHAAYEGAIKIHENHAVLVSASETLLIAIRSNQVNQVDKGNHEAMKEALKHIRTDFIEAEGSEKFSYIREFGVYIDSHLDEKLVSKWKGTTTLLDNVDLLNSTARALKDNKIFDLMKCSSDNSDTFNKLVTIMEGAKGLRDFSKQSEDIKVFQSFLKDIGKVQKALVNARNHVKQADGVTVRKLRKFGKEQDLTTSFLEAVNAMAIVNQAHSRQKEFLVLVRSNLDDTYGDFPRKWEKRGRSQLKTLMNELDTMENYIGDNGNDGMKGVERVFMKASKMKGVTISWDGLDTYIIGINPVNPDFGKKLKDVSQLQLNFASFSGHFQSASLSTTVLHKFLENLQEDEEQEEEKMLQSEEFPMWTAICVLLGVVLLILVLAVFCFFLTPFGRRRWKKFCLQRYGTREGMELYWRYSYWTDNEAEKNALCEAVREINYDHVKAIVERGAYINVYNSFGNTPLHAATKYGHAKIVEVLIRNGADRNAYNLENKTAEQLLEENSVTSRQNSEVTVRVSKKEKEFAEIEAIFTKYENRVFKPRIPELLPTMEFRIRIDQKITKNAAAIFTEKYKGNVTDQMSGVTHLIVPTDKDGVLTSDDFGYIMCVFLPTMLMQEQWMRACLEKKSNFRDDYKFRVEKVRYKGKVFDTVLKWAQWVHKQMLPYLFGVQLHLCADVGDAVSSQLRQLVEMHGATWCEEVPVKEHFNLGSHPFHHFHLGPLFVIHGSNMQPIEHLKNDDMYTLMTFDEFIVFMLQMKVKYDAQRKTPIPVKPFDDCSTGGASTNLSSKK